MLEKYHQRADIILAISSEPLGPAPLQTTGKFYDLPSGTAQFDLKEWHVYSRGYRPPIRWSCVIVGKDPPWHRLIDGDPSFSSAASAVTMPWQQQAVPTTIEPRISDASRTAITSDPERAPMPGASCRLSRIHAPGKARLKRAKRGTGCAIPVTGQTCGAAQAERHLPSGLYETTRDPSPAETRIPGGIRQERRAARSMSGARGERVCTRAAMTWTGAVGNTYAGLSTRISSRAAGIPPGTSIHP